MAAVLQHWQVRLEHLVQLLGESPRLLHLRGQGLQISMVHLDHGREEVRSVLEHPVGDVAVAADGLDKNVAFSIISAK